MCAAGQVQVVTMVLRVVENSSQGELLLQSSASSERVRISLSSAEASRQSCLCSLSSAPLPGVQLVQW